MQLILIVIGTSKENLVLLFHRRKYKNYYFFYSYKSLRLVLILLLRISRLKLLSEVKSIIETKLILCITINYRIKYVERRAKLLKI